MDCEKSGDKEQGLGEFPPGSHVTKAVVNVRGVAFQGKLKFLKGVKVTPSPVIYRADGKPKSPTGTEQAFIVDFGGLRSILKLEIANEKGLITLVLPWMGTEFSPKPIYPPTASGPIPHTDGTEVVGLTGVETTKLLVQIIASGATLTEADFLDHCRITTATYPSNVKASLNGRLPFWTHPGVLNNTVELTRLVEDLNTVLKDAKAPTPVKLLLTTDTPGVLIVDFDPAKNLDVDQSANARWGNQATLDVPLQGLEAQSVSISFPTKGSGPWRVGRLILDLAGRFPVWQAYSGQGSNTPGKLGMRISAQFSAARRFIFDEAGELYGFSLLLRSPADEAEMSLEVAAEKDGQPDSGKPLATADVSLSAETLATSRWTDILFSSPIKIGPQEGMWVVAKAKTGSVEWVGATEPVSTPSAMLFNNEGGQWQHYPLVEERYPVAQIRVLRRPFTKENTPLLDITWSTPTQKLKQSVDLSEGTTRVELTLPQGQPLQVPPVGGTVSIPLEMTARASGTLMIKGATAFYKEPTP